MRLGVILSGQFVSNDLCADFGSIIPAELPLANKPLYSYQVETLSRFCDQVVCTIPEGYKTKFVSGSQLRSQVALSLRDAIEHVVKSVEGVTEYIFYFGDTLLNFSFVSQAFYVGKTQFDYPTWHYTDKGKVFAGVFSIYDYDLKKALKENKSTKPFLESLAETLNHVETDEWYDFGNYTTYYHSRKRFLETRSFNEIQISEGAILSKKSSDIGKMYFEFCWLEYFSAKYPTNCPTPKNFQIYSNTASYDLEYFPLPTLADLFVFGAKDSDFWKFALTKCFSLIKLLENGEIKSLNEDRFYWRKVEERAQKYDYISLGFSEKDISDQRELASELDRFDSKIGGAHGDLCFSNILWDNRLCAVKVIDPRGFMDRSKGRSVSAPLFYDIFKLCHSVIGGYDSAIVGCEVEHDRFDVLNWLEGHLGVDQKWLYAGMSHLFFTMIPLHCDNVERQNSFKKLAFKYYANYTSCRKGFAI